MLAELNPTMTYAEIIKQQLAQADVTAGESLHE